VVELHGDGARAVPVQNAITVEIGGAVMRAAHGVDPMWLRDVLRA
jgi:hypothetical protein